MIDRSTIVLCVLAIASVTAAVYVARHDRAARGGGPDGGDRLLLHEPNFDPESITHVRLERRGEAPMVFEKSGQAWSQVEPFAHPMDPYSIEQLVQTAPSIRVTDTLSPDAFASRLSLDSIGLDPPEAIVTYTSDQSSVALELGRRGIAGRAYLRVRGRDDVLVVSHELHDRAIGMDAKEWRDRAIFQNAGVESQRIEMSASDDRWIIERDRRQWRMIQPAKTRVDEAALDEPFAALGRARSSGFLLDQPEELAAFGLAQPAGALTVTSERVIERGGAVAREAFVQRLLVGAPVAGGSDDRFGMIEGRPTVVRLSAAVLASLFPSKERLVAHTATGVAPADVKIIRISGPDHEFRLERDLDRWITVDHGGADVPPQLANELLANLAALRASAVRFEKFPSELSLGHITLHGFDGRPRDTVRIARDPQSGNWALENGDNVLRYYPSSMNLPLSPDDFGLQPTP